jgi:hypothetical protein
MPRPHRCDNYRVGGPYTEDQCRLCWLYHNDPQYKNLLDRPEMPSLLRQAVNLVGAVVKHVSAGMPAAGEEEKSRRMALCMACEHWQDGRCTQCGCFTAAKTAWAREKCPVGKW